MKITGTRSYIKVEIDGKLLIVQGELTTTPIFYADGNSIQRWEPPHQEMIISEQEKNKIINDIIEHTQNSQVPVLFE